jgi:transposase-like protein
MTTRTNRRYSNGLKLEIVQEVAQGEKGQAQIGREHGVCRDQVSRWYHQYRQRGEAAFNPTEEPLLKQPLSEDEKLVYYERLCGQLSLQKAVLQEEVDLLKKAFRLFPSNSGMK